MSALAILRELLSGAPVLTASDNDGLPTDELRFALEYRARPDPSKERAKLALLLGSESFLLVPFAGLDDFLILRFPTIERTLPARELFAIGYELCDAMDLTSAEPDLGTRFFGDPSPVAPMHEAEAAHVIGPMCWVSTPAPPNRGWALEAARITEAWPTSRGEGILIGQPDTGVADHHELENGMLRLELSWNAIDGSNNPTDPLRKDAANPGHGTGTASVAASRHGGLITGAAPEAGLVPIRCLDDVKVFNTTPVTAAILHAKAVGCDIVTMSLGGVPGRALHRAIQVAIEHDLIVVAAAGNCVGTVVWPARYAEVICVAGTNIGSRPWKGSSRGSSVDIAAPAELVWRAERAHSSDDLSGIAPGQGTSFATALVAGVAALWLAAKGRERVREAARQRGTTVQAMFRAAIKRTARVPSQWDEQAYGPGIIDAAALLDLALDEIPAARVEAAVGREPMADFLDEEISPGPADREFDWPRYQMEIATISLSQAELGGAPTDLAVEAKWSTTRPSAALSSAAKASKDSRLHRFAEADGASIGRPVMLPTKLPPLPRPKLLARSGVRPEGSARTLGSSDAQSRQNSIDELERLIRASGTSSTVDRDILEGANEAFEKSAKGTPLSGTARIGLEALVRLRDRPSLRVRDGRIDIEDRRTEGWYERLFMMLSTNVIQSHLASIGRIDCDFAHVGTGFVVGDGLILTNRHVLQAFAAPVPRRNEPSRWVMTSDNVTIDFADQPSSRTADTRFRITGVLGAGPNDIDYTAIDLGHLDAALLIAETDNGKRNLPPRLPIDADETSVDPGRTLLVVGYPAQPASLPTRTDGNIDTEVTARLNTLFGADYGTKYAAPGDVIAALGGRSADGAHLVFCHDATTLVGNSGSALIGAIAPQDIVGLHFGGQWMRENYAHSLAALRGKTGFLDQGGIDWSNKP
ncbi:S8 family serine peptidase [Mesorhizobium newzealandense]|uniref:S8 family serine peptidase n=1 Tax=Mesorhizobium newzealandense TaxID=1300302 RepID=A0ABW4UGE3_9HYPH